MSEDERREVLSREQVSRLVRDATGVLDPGLDNHFRTLAESHEALRAEDELLKICEHSLRLELDTAIQIVNTERAEKERLRQLLGLALQAVELTDASVIPVPLDWLPDARAALQPGATSDASSSQ